MPRYQIKQYELNNAYEEILMKRTCKVLALLLCLLFWAVPSTMGDETLKIFGNANMDQTIDEKDIAYVEDIISGKSQTTEFADANNDGKVDAQDIDQIQVLIDDNAKSITIKDSANRVVTVKLPINRFISADYRTTEPLIAIGAAEKICAVDTTFHERMSEFGLADRPEVAVHAGEVNYELILKMQSDLVVVAASKASTANDTSKKLKGCPVIAISPTTRKSIIPDLRLLGYVLGERKGAEKLIGWINEHEDIVEDRVKDIPSSDYPKFYYESSSDQKLWYAYTPVGGSILDGCAADNIASSLGSSSSYQIEPEWLLTQNPDFMFLDMMQGAESGPGKTEEDMAALWMKLKDQRQFPGFLDIKAIKINNFYIIDRDITSGPRWVVGHAYFAKCMHPELFTDIHPDEWNLEYLKEFFGLDITGTWAYPMPK